MQDAFNLAWKLALLHKGYGKPALLDSYEAERLPAAKQLLDTTDRVTWGLDSLLSLHSSIGQTVRNHQLHFVTELGFVQRRLSRNLAMLDVCYHDSPAVAGSPSAAALLAVSSGGEGSQHPPKWPPAEEGAAPGERASDGTLRSADDLLPIRLHQALRGTGHKLLLFAGGQPSKLGFERLAVIIAAVHHRFRSLLRPLLITAVNPAEPPPAMARRSEALPAVPELTGCPLLLDPGGSMHRRYGASSDSVYLIRPDGYIGYRSQPAEPEPLLRYLAQVFA